MAPGGGVGPGTGRGTQFPSTLRYSLDAQACPGGVLTAVVVVTRIVVEVVLVAVIVVVVDDDVVVVGSCGVATVVVTAIAVGPGVD